MFTWCGEITACNLNNQCWYLHSKANIDFMKRLGITNSSNKYMKTIFFQHIKIVYITID